MNRRQFITNTTAISFATILSGLPTRAANFNGKLRKAMIVKEVTERALEPLKAAGFQGVETNHVCPEEEAPPAAPLPRSSV
jgi:hypothetical protein